MNSFQNALSIKAITMSKRIMLRFLIVSILFILRLQVNAQWTTGSVMVNSNAGVVEVKGINSTVTPAFHVYNSVAGGSPSGTKVELQRFSAPGNTSMFNVAGIFAKTNGTNSSQSYLSLNPINTSGTGFAEGLTIYAGGNIGIGIPTPTNKLQIGANPAGFGGNDFVVSNTTSSLAITNGVTSGVNYSMLYGSADIAIRPGYGKMSFYANAAGNVGIGTNTISGTRLYVFQSSNTDWTASYYNDGGNGKGLRIKGGDGSSSNATPLFQIDDNLDRTKFQVQTSGKVGIGITSPDGKLHVKGCAYFGNQNEDSSHRIALGGSGGDYGSVGYGYLYTNTSQTYNYSVGDYASQLRFDQGGFTFNTAAIGTVGSPVSFTSAMVITRDGNVGIGTVISPDAKLAVRGTIHTQEVLVDLAGAVVPDYVFESNYDLKSLDQVEDYIKENKHLPEVPSAKEMEAEGLKLKEMNMLLLKKVEELTLYLIQQQKEINALKEKVKQH
jgi:hypothetical protein